MKILCFLGIHDWRRINHFSFLNTEENNKRTTVYFTKVCKNCGKAKSDIKLSDS